MKMSLSEPNEISHKFKVKYLWFHMAEIYTKFSLLMQIEKHFYGDFGMNMFWFVTLVLWSKVKW